jgi:hypothetical protein
MFHKDFYGRALWLNLHIQNKSTRLPGNIKKGAFFKAPFGCGAEGDRTLGL